MRPEVGVRPLRSSHGDAHFRLPRKKSDKFVKVPMRSECCMPVMASTGGMVQLGVVEAIEEMNAAGAGGGDADADLA